MGNTPIDFPTEQVTRLSVLETQLEHYKEVQAQHTAILDALSNKIERVTSSFNKVEITLPQFTEQVNALNKEFVAFKEYYIQEQLRLLQEETTTVKQEAKDQEARIKEVTEVKTKNNIMWAGLGFLLTAICGLIINAIWGK